MKVITPWPFSGDTCRHPTMHLVDLRALARPAEPRSGRAPRPSRQLAQGDRHEPVPTRTPARAGNRYRAGASARTEHASRPAASFSARQPARPGQGGPAETTTPSSAASHHRRSHVAARSTTRFARPRSGTPPRRRAAPRRSPRRARGANLPRAPVRHRADGFLDRHGQVTPVHVVQINDVGLQPARLSSMH